VFIGPHRRGLSMCLFTVLVTTVSPAERLYRSRCCLGEEQSQTCVGQWNRALYGVQPMHIGGIPRLMGVSGGDAGCRYHYGSNLLSLLQFFSSFIHFYAVVWRHFVIQHLRVIFIGHSVSMCSHPYVLWALIFLISLVTRLS